MAEKIVLSRSTYNRFDNAAKTVNELAQRANSTKGGIPFSGAGRQYIARLTQETTTPNSGLTWQAEEVYLDDAGAVQAKVNGFQWTDANPVFTLNAASQGDVILVSQAGRPKINTDPAKLYWFGNPGGGGGAAFYRLLVNADFTLSLNGSNSLDVSLIDDQNTVITAAVSVTQRKFTSANFYSGEILYAIDYSAGGYLLDPFLSGIGGS